MLTRSRLKERPNRCAVRIDKSYEEELGSLHENRTGMSLSTQSMNVEIAALF